MLAYRREQPTGDLELDSDLDREAKSSGDLYLALSFEFLGKLWREPINGLLGRLEIVRRLVCLKLEGTTNEKLTLGLEVELGRGVERGDGADSEDLAGETGVWDSLFDDLLLVLFVILKLRGDADVKLSLERAGDSDVEGVDTEGQEGNVGLTRDDVCPRDAAVNTVDRDLRSAWASQTDNTHLAGQLPLLLFDQLQRSLLALALGLLGILVDEVRVARAKDRVDEIAGLDVDVGGVCVRLAGCNRKTGGSNVLEGFDRSDSSVLDSNDNIGNLVVGGFRAFDHSINRLYISRPEE